MMTTTQAAREGSRIVVGVDCADSSKAALSWAVKQAALTGAEVDAVTAWQIQAAYGYGYAYAVGGGDTPDMEQLARQMLDEAIAAVAGEEPGVVIHPVVAQDNAARALLDAAKGAELLVVGSRGHAGFTEALLGSVGQYCVHHAECPVVIVRDTHGLSG
jgi:nucleotide-binding universal stress UspA family protein